MGTDPDSDLKEEDGKVKNGEQSTEAEKDNEKELDSNDKERDGRRRGGERNKDRNRDSDRRRDSRNGERERPRSRDRRERNKEYPPRRDRREREDKGDDVKRERSDDATLDKDIKREGSSDTDIKQEGVHGVYTKPDRKPDRNDDRREPERRERDPPRGSRRDVGRERERLRDDRYRDRERERGDRYARDRRPRDNRTRRPSPRRRRSSSDRPRRRDREEREKERRREREEREREREERRKAEEKRRQEDELTPEEKMARAIERDKRTVFVSHLHPKVEDIELFEFFSKAGKVRDVRFITDKSGRSKGLGYVEFYDPSAVAGAINLQGNLVRDHPIQVKHSEAEKNAAAAALPPGFVNTPRTNLKLFVGNLHKKIRAADVKEIFQIFKFGDIEKVEMPKPDEHWCYVKYRSADDSKKAMLQMSQMDILGQKLQIGVVTETETNQAAQSGIGSMDQDRLLSTDQRLALTAKLSKCSISSPATKAETAPGAIPGMVAVDAPPPDMSMLHPGLAPPPLQQPEDMSCLVLSKLFDPSEEEDEDFDEDIEDEFLEHCNKLGVVRHIFVDKFSKDGELYIRFANSAGGLSCYQKMNGRWYNKRQIVAKVIDPEAYAKKFPGSSTNS